MEKRTKPAFLGGFYVYCIHLCKNRKIFYLGYFCAFLAGYRSHLLIFIAVIYWLFPLFYLGQTFLPERKVFPSPFIQALFIQAHFARRSHERLRARRAFTARLYLARTAPTKKPAAPTQKGPTQKPREPVAPLNAHLEIPIQKASRERRTFTNMRLYLACRRAPRKTPTLARPQPLKRPFWGSVPQTLPCLRTQKSPTQRPNARRNAPNSPMQKPGEGAGATQKSHAKTPGVIPGVLVEKFI